MASDTATTLLERLIDPAYAAMILDDARPAILWAQSGGRPLWSSETAVALFGQPAGTGLTFPSMTPALARIRDFARTAELGDMREEGLRFLIGSQFTVLQAENHLVPLADGGLAVLSLFDPASPVAAAPAAQPVATPAPVSAPAEVVTAAPVAAAVHEAVHGAGASLAKAVEHIVPAAPRIETPVIPSQPALPEIAAVAAAPVVETVKAQVEAAAATLSPALVEAALPKAESLLPKIAPTSLAKAVSTAWPQAPASPANVAAKSIEVVKSLGEAVVSLPVDLASKAGEAATTVVGAATGHATLPGLADAEVALKAKATAAATDLAHHLPAAPSIEAAKSLGDAAAALPADLASKAREATAALVDAATSHAASPTVPSPADAGAAIEAKATALAPAMSAAVAALHGHGAIAESASATPAAPRSEAAKSDPAIPAAPTADAPHSEATRATPAPPARPVRFVFQTDATGHLVSIAPAFAQALGLRSDTLAGKPLADVVGAFDEAGAKRVADALASKTTWSGLALSWPTGDGTQDVPVEFSGTPNVATDRSFAGFTGFGVCRLDRARPARPKAPEAAPVLPAGAAVHAAPVPTLAATVVAAAASAAVAGAATAHSHDAAPRSADLDEDDDEADEVTGAEIAVAKVAATEHAPHHEAPAVPVEILQPPAEAVSPGAPALETEDDEADEQGATAEAATSPTAQADPHAPAHPDVETREDDRDADGEADDADDADLSTQVEPTAVKPDAPAAPQLRLTEAPSPVAESPVSPVPPSAKASPAPSGSEVDFDALARVDDEDVASALPAPGLPTPVTPTPAAHKSLQDNAPAMGTGGNIVHLPQNGGSANGAFGAPRVVSLKVSGQVPATMPEQGLSTSERHAFREIAKALGARFEGAGDVPSTGASPAGEKPPGDKPAAPVAKIAETPAAPTKALGEPPLAAENSSGAVAATGELPWETMRSALVPGHVTAPSHPPVAATPAKGIAAAAAAVIERLPVGVLVFRDEAPLYLNRPMLDLTGYATTEEFKALHGLGKLFRGRAAASFSSGEYDTVTIMGRDGQTLPVDAHLQTIDWSGEPASLVTFRRALDAEQGPRLRTLEMELKARRTDLAEARAMLDTATDGVISLDDNGRIMALNRSAEALFGYDQKELAGERFTLLLAPESHAMALDYLDGLKSGGVASVLNDGREVIGKERKGGRIPLFMTVGRVSETGKFAAVVRDMTAWKRAESELTDAKRAAERASALKSDFLAKISHEIRTPMNAIIGFAEVMRDERLGPIGTERYKEYLKDIHTSGEHVISLVNDLLDLSKIEAGRMDLTFGSVDLNTIVSSCLGIMQPQANRDRVIMRSQLAPKLPPVVADERSIRQIVLNLLSNASKFTEPGGQVIVSTALTEAGEAVIRVRDTGIGMTEPEIQAALEPFRQLSTTRHRGGTGLGLPLTKALVEANRAAFSIRSKSREGTLVEVTFPPTRVLAE